MNNYDDDDSDDGSSQDNSAAALSSTNNHDSNNHNNANNNNNETAQTKQELDGTYELVILKRSTDSLGNPYILARHKAYDDEQCVHIHWSRDHDDTTNNNDNANNSAISIEYQDGETVCTGTWNTQLLRFEGTVCQRLRMNDAAFLTSSP